MNSRRDFLKIGLSSAAVVSLSSSLPSFLSSFALADQIKPSALSNDNVLVVVQLSGGNDGLNTIAPVHHDAYRKARPNLQMKERAIRLNDELSLNPGLGAFKKVFDDGKLAIVNGCGYPNPNRSHFRSMEIWHTANPVESQPTGWLGHYLDHFLRGTDNPVEAMNIGAELPQALVNTGAPVPSIQSIDDFRVRTDPNSPFDAKLEQQIIRDLSEVKNATPALQFLSRQATNAIVSSEQIRRLTAAYKPDAKYPQGALGGQLRLIAQILSAGMGTRLCYCQVGGFDTHANQLYGHEQLLAQVSQAIAAFHEDLTVKGLNDKVAVMCFSEFGRRMAENNSAGTDHGAAGPMFLSGGKVKGGLYGAYPSLTELDSGDLKFTTDFRRVYSTLLDRWLNVDSKVVLGAQYESLAMLDATKATTRPVSGIVAPR